MVERHTHHGTNPAQLGSALRPRLTGRKTAEPSARRARTAKAGTMVRKKRRGMRPDRLQLAANARSEGMCWHEIAALFRGRFGVNGLVAMRAAHQMSQRDLADAWNRRWPDEPKTFKNFSYWENWPARSGYEPSLKVLFRLAELFECAVADLIDGYANADFRHLDALYGMRATVQAAPATQALAVALEGVVERLAEVDIDQVAAAGLTWADRIPDRPAHALLMKLSAGLGLAATHLATPTPATPGDSNSDGDADPGGDLSGLWCLHADDRPAMGPLYDYSIVLRRHHGRLIGASLPHPTGGRLRLDLTTDTANALAGTWTAHHPAGTAHGCLRLHHDQPQQTLHGQWIGFDTGGAPFTSHTWQLHRTHHSLGGAALIALQPTGLTP